MTNIENRAKIKEMFTSIQGEGHYIGVKQLFIRFCACNLRCYYCDTDYMPVNIEDNGSYYDFSAKELEEYLRDNFDLDSIHSISLTGGEPLIWADFLKEFMQRVKVKYYLETNATIADNLEKIIQNVDIISADIKLPSCSGILDSFERHRKFFETIKNSRITCALEKEFNCDNKNIFAKIVFDEFITDEEIDECTKLAKEFDLPLILQPRMIEDKLSVTSKFIQNVFEKFVTKHKDTRLIPQVHKFIDVE